MKSKPFHSNLATKCLAFVLSVLLLFYAVPTAVFAEEVKDDATGETTSVDASFPEEIAVLDSNADEPEAADTYDEYDRPAQQIVVAYPDSGSSTDYFYNVIDYTYVEKNGQTSAQIGSYTSTVNDGTPLTYTYTYDAMGNVTKIAYSNGQQIRYVYDDLGQLIREDNTLRNQTYTYTYDNAGNILSKNTYALTASAYTPTNPTSTYTYTYGDSEWGDKLTSYRGVNFTYDYIGNPKYYYNGTSYNFTWTGRQLTKAVHNNQTITFTYNDEGMRTTKGGIVYYLNGTQILGESNQGAITLYIYDAYGAPIGFQHLSEEYGSEWEVYWYEKNLQGDIVAVYNSAGTKLVSYVYDAFGNATITYHKIGRAHV